MASLIADLLAPFAEAASIRLRDTGGTLRKRIIVSLCSADPESVHRAIFREEPFDWQTVRPFLFENASAMTTTDWVRLVTLLHFVAEPLVTRPEVAKLLASAQAGIRASTQGLQLSPIESMQVAFARAGLGHPPWDSVCKALVLVNLEDVDSAEALRQLLPRGGGSSTIINHLASFRHSRDEYTRTFSHLLSPEACNVATHHILRSIWARDERMEHARRTTATLFGGTDKPSLTRILREHGERNRAGVSDFVRFCQGMRLPDMMSHPLKVACYGLCSLQGAPQDGRMAAVNRLLAERGGSTLSTLMLLSSSMAAPLPQAADVAGEVDAPTMRAFIMGMQHSGTPFPELQQFRQLCSAQQRAIAGSSASQQQAPAVSGSSSWTTVLRLYLAAYCPPPLHKDMWEHVSASSAPDLARYAVAVGGSSATASANKQARELDSQAVQAFVQRTPPALDALATIWLQNDAA